MMIKARMTKRLVAVVPVSILILGFVPDLGCTSQEPANEEASADTPRVGSIDLYGLGEVSEDDIRHALGLHAGDRLEVPSEELEGRLETVPGVARASVTTICCDDDGDKLLYVGIASSEATSFEYRPSPTSDLVLDEEIFTALEEFGTAFSAAVRSGNSGDDISAGHSLMDDAATRAQQERFLVLAQERLDELRRVLRNAADPAQRAGAALMIGYAPDKRAVIGDLLDAVRDSDGIVRNNATRALGAIAHLAQRKPELGLEIDAEPFVAMLNSVVWSDRNKGLMVLHQLTHDRDAELLSLLRKQALPSLIEMTRWSNLGHAYGAIIILGRMSGLSDEEVEDALMEGEREALLLRIETVLRAEGSVTDS